MANEALIQTRVPIAVAEDVAALSAAEGLSVAAWVRRLLIKEVGQVRTPACTSRVGEKPNLGVNPSWILERVEEMTSTEVKFHMLHGPGHPLLGAPVTPGYLSDIDWYQHQDDHRFHLQGSPKPWCIVRSMFDARSGRMELVLRSE